MDSKFQEKIKELFLKKKYKDIVLKIEENFKPKNRPAGISNLSGVCKLLSSESNYDNVISALNDFEDCFKKSTLEPQKIEALTNYISACIRGSKKNHELSKYFIRAKKIYEEYENQIGFNEKLYVHGADLYKYLLDHNKIKKILKKLIEKQTKSKIIACLYSYMNNYLYDWKQKDYLIYSKKLKFFFPKYKVNSLNNINFHKNNKIRIGFVSKDFAANHSITYFLKNTLTYFDKNKFETYGISLSSDNFLKESSLELKENFNKWIDLSMQNNQEVINRIQEMRIDILIDLMGLTHADRIEIFNSRVSPIQISWLGFLNTVGLEHIDYLIADHQLIKDEEEDLYSEKILKFPRIWSCHSGFNFKRKFSDPPFKKNNYITFGSFNNYLKISDTVIQTWSKILKNISNSKLILKSSFGYNNQLIMEKFNSHGVSKSIEFYDRSNFSNLENHLKLYSKVDIALDTFPYNGVTTTFEALWSGIPVLVMKGYNMNSRCGESILKNAGLENFLSATSDEYIKKAIYYSNNLEILQNERFKIFNNILNSNLFDSKQFSQDFQDSILKVYNSNIS